MIRSKILNEVIEPFDGVSQFRASMVHYKQLFWDFSHSFVAGDVKNYNRLRMAIEQYLCYREECQNITSIGSLEWWLNTNPHALYSSPLNVIGQLDITPFKKLTIRNFKHAGQLNNIHRHVGLVEEEYAGTGWTCDIIIELRTGRFGTRALTTGLAGLGIYATDMLYEGSVGNRYYRAPCEILERDFQFCESDHMAPWSETDDNDDEDDLINEGESKARWFEDGLLDDEIEGLHHRVF